jgi:hypothetical protein
VNRILTRYEPQLVAAESCNRFEQTSHAEPGYYHHVLLQEERKV